MTAKTAPKVTLWEFFQQLGKTLWHYCRSAALCSALVVLLAAMMS